MKTILIGNGYWGSIVQKKLKEHTQLLYVVNSKDNIDYILEKNDVDYVFVCTPTETHYDIVKKCISYNKNVFCEKPFTGDLFKANELYDMAQKNDVKLFIDNIFLYRKEFLNLTKKPSSSIKFIWRKHEEIFKENLFNTLLYHDLYILLEMSKNNQWSVEHCNLSDEKLSITLVCENLKTEFIYDRTYLGNKEKKIIIDDLVIDFSSPLNDPLSEIINDLKNNKINFEKNKKITIETIKLLNKIKNESLLYTSRNFK